MNLMNQQYIKKYINKKYINKESSKTKNKFCVLLVLIFVFNIFTGCSSNTAYKNSTKQKQELISADQIWDQKIKYLCKTDCKDFDNFGNLKKEYVLKVCQYYKTLSSTNIEYNESLKKYIIPSREVSEIVFDLFGTTDFKCDDEDCYDSKNGVYFFDDYLSCFDDEEYEYDQVIKLDDERLEFHVVVTDGQTGVKKKEKYILKKNKTEIEDSKNNKNIKDSYYVVSKQTEK